MVVASRVRVQVSARAMPMRFTGLGHAGRGNATPKLVAMSPSRSRWGWPPALPLLGTILDFARLDSNPADPSGEFRSSSGPIRGSRERLAVGRNEGYLEG